MSLSHPEFCPAGALEQKHLKTQTIDELYPYNNYTTVNCRSTFRY